MTIIAGLMLGLLLYGLEFVIVSASMRTIADELHGQTLQAWVTTSYMVATTIATPLFGKLSDIYGRKRLYLTAILVFLAGSLLCGLAGSLYELAVYRAIQGVGGGGLAALAFAIMGDILTPELRARYQIYFSAVSVVAGAAGPPVGGLFASADTLLGIDGWRWSFLINLPIGLVALAIVALRYRMPAERREQPVDYAGAGWLVVGLGPLLVVAEQGRTWGWSSPLSLSLCAVGAVGLAAFLVTESRMGPAAVIPLRLFRSRVFTLVNTVSVVIGIGLFGSLVFLPLYLQLVKGQSPEDAGLLLILQMAGVLTTSRSFSKVINRSGRYRAFLVGGTGLATATLLGFASLGPGSPLWVAGALVYLLGAGMGVCLPVTLIALQNNSPKEDMGVSSAAFTFFRGIGGTAGTAAFLSLMFALSEERVAKALARAGREPGFRAASADPEVAALPANRQVIDAAAGTGRLDLDDTSFLLHTDPRIAAPVVDGLASSISTVFLVGAAVMSTGVVLALLLPGPAPKTAAGAAEASPAGGPAPGAVPRAPR
ncbi:MFS transporter [Streptomyces sp. CSDS2]|uniref:MFS transporter n=1 Tax=Streptomyces sp. CSDS2 TaxID=3055051 RepID=UPI0025B1A5AF|nr:MFS transporter [Streptomyces sp. CSDS2]MDN3258436.1 MFS transporter [Streptomyces sp. CSDS2]